VVSEIKVVNGGQNGLTPKMMTFLFEVGFICRFLPFNSFEKKKNTKIMLLILKLNTNYGL
jgi:hypothetical protein